MGWRPERGGDDALRDLCDAWWGVVAQARKASGALAASLDRAGDSDAPEHMGLVFSARAADDADMVRSLMLAARALARMIEGMKGEGGDPKAPVEGAEAPAEARFLSSPVVSTPSGPMHAGGGDGSGDGDLDESFNEWMDRKGIEHPFVAAERVAREGAEGAVGRGAKDALDRMQELVESELAGFPGPQAELLRIHLRKRLELG